MRRSRASEEEESNHWTSLFKSGISREETADQQRDSSGGAAEELHPTAPYDPGTAAEVCQFFVWFLYREQAQDQTGASSEQV